MRKARIAEWILSLVTSPERAASTVGDLLETEATVPFWMSVVRTACFMLWRDFTLEWRRMLGLATAGLVATYALPVVVAVAYGIAAAVILGMAGVLGLVDLQHFSPSALASTGALVRISIWVSFLTLALVAFQVGRWMARRSPGRELVPCATLVALDAVVSSAVGVWWGGLHLSSLSPAIPFYLAALFAGAAQVRRATLRSL